MYAIVETGGKQYRVKPGDTIAVERLSGEPGEVLDLGRVLLLAGNGDGSTRVGTPGVEGAVVRAEVVEHARGEKIIVFRYKSKVRYRRKTGHRQALTRVRITDILVDGASSTLQRVEAETAPPEGAHATRAVEVEETPAAEAARAETSARSTSEDVVAPAATDEATTDVATVPEDTARDQA
jgi:large subunit ribosomal protein L21